MEVQVLQAQSRAARGKRAAFVLRRAGQLPAVVYGEGAEPAAVSLNAHEFEALLRHHERVFQLDIDGRREKVLLHEIQWDALGDRPRHVDFLRISHHATVEVKVEIEFIGHPKGLAKGGEFVKQMTELLVSCAPEAIPNSLPLKVGDLDVGSTVKVSDLALPAGVKALAPADALVCAVNLRGIEAEAAPAPEGEAGAEPEVIGKGKKETEEEAAPEA
ncbi:MAG: 50S ribosomal protein L25 [Planctomycetota bacterium]|nr:MAG: 50S ribosomal protein L25 [Planctomycetota bacterium]